MKRYRKVYSFDVVDEIQRGEYVYVIDRSYVNNSSAIQEANKLGAEELIRIINDKNENNRYEFFKVVATDE